MSLLSGKRILLVDDDQDILTVFKIILLKWQASVDAFSDPLQALEAFKEKPGAYDLVITDVRMPKVTGPDLVQKMLLIRPDTLTLYVSAFDTDSKLFGAISHKQLEEDFVRKPVTAPQLCNAVRRKISSQDGS